MPVAVEVKIGSQCAVRCMDGTIHLCGADDDGGDPFYAQTSEDVRLLMDVLDAAVAVADRDIPKPAPSDG